MVNKHMKLCSTSLIIRGMKIKAAMRYHFIPTKMAIIRKISNKLRYEETGTRKDLVICLISHSKRRSWDSDLGSLVPEPHGVPALSSLFDTSLAGKEQDWPRCASHVK